MNTKLLTYAQALQMEMDKIYHPTYAISEEEAIANSGYRLRVKIQGMPDLESYYANEEMAKRAQNIGYLHSWSLRPMSFVEAVK